MVVDDWEMATFYSGGAEETSNAEVRSEWAPL
jgi:hypothetical protein